MSPVVPLQLLPTHQQSYKRTDKKDRRRKKVLPPTIINIITGKTERAYNDIAK